ncbi:MAG: acyl-ACP--UDP-N-acetylglucosamine O-acyltransferase [Puniceicoccales bacterium]|jgi:UDP-N-acetylglucosamine acyltransferase|nr:acyl-ACP--UDP-N-acetylglucosamine O-acyltransferase [Puniceicoccales bacterium]
MPIHPTAIVKFGAELAHGVTVDEYAYIGPLVKIGRGCVIKHHATVDGKTTLGENNVVHPYAYVGGLTHDLKYEGGEPGLEIGSRNVFREFCTMHAATRPETSTIIGSDNTFLAYSHVAHDCIVGNHVIMSAQAALGGHVEIDDYANIGWSAGIHQFCKIGKYAMVGAASKTVQDILPFMLADGNPSKVRYINVVNLQRNGFSEAQISDAKRIFKIFYLKNLNRQQALDVLNGENLNPSLRETILTFLSKSIRGFA